MTAEQKKKQKDTRGARKRNAIRSRGAQTSATTRKKSAASGWCPEVTERIPATTGEGSATTEEEKRPRHWLDAGVVLCSDPSNYKGADEITSDGFGGDSNQLQRPPAVTRNEPTTKYFKTQTGQQQRPSNRSFRTNEHVRLLITFVHLNISFLVLFFLLSLCNIAFFVGSSCTLCILQGLVTEL